MKLLRYTTSLFLRAIVHIARCASLCLLLNFTLIDYTAVAQDTSCGIIWHEPVVLAYEYGLPSIAAQGDTVHVTWWGSTIKLPYIRSTNEGVQWDTVRDLYNYSDSASNGSINTVVANKENVFLFFEITNTGTIDTYIYKLKSSDGGATWDTITRVTNFYSFLRDIAIKDDTIAVSLFIESQHGYPSPFMMTSTDAGTSWRVAPDTLGEFVKPALSDGMLHITLNADEYPEIAYWKSYDLGFTWSLKTILSSIDNHGSMISSIAASHNRVLATWRDSKYGCSSDLSCGIVVRNSDSGGDEWFDEENITGGYFGIPRDITIRENIVAVVWDAANNAGGIGTRIRTSFDEGAIWCPVYALAGANTGNPVVAITQNAIHVVYSNVTTSRVIYRRGEIVNTSVPEPHSEIPSRIELFQNFPNPFNPKTAIGFSLLAVGNVTLKVYDIYGKEVATLINNKQYEAGKHTVEWNAEGCASGMYFYRLAITNNKNITSVITKKMILMK